MLEESEALKQAYLIKEAKEKIPGMNYDSWLEEILNKYTKCSSDMILDIYEKEYQDALVEMVGRRFSRECILYYVDKFVVSRKRGAR